MRPLRGVKVLDFSRVLAGPMASQILAELGADVIKVERPGEGDESRSYPPRLQHGTSAYFVAFNRTKRSVTINLKSPQGCEIARDLAARTDVLIENFLPETMDRFGLGYEPLRALNPGLVYVSLTGFGQTGPDRDQRGYDTVFQALSGMMSLTGHPDGPPAKAGVPVADLTSGLWATISALAGLLGRISSGAGCRVDLSMMDVQLSLLAVAALPLFARGEEPVRSGTEHPGRVPSAAFQCQDGRWVHITAGDRHWMGLCRVLGLDDLESDAHLATNKGRLERRKEVTDALGGAIANWKSAELVVALRHEGVPVGPVRTVSEALGDAQAVSRRAVVSIQVPTEGAFPALRTPLHLEGFDDPEPGSPPELGGDTEEVLESERGLDDGAIAALRRAEAI
ncbi:MAG: CaiB/BaiF CoA transferase family protein [Acidimicrobiales bacterium]